MTSPSPKITRRRVASVVGMFAAVAFLTMIVVQISLTPDVGAATPDELAAAYRQARTDHDEGAIQHLVYQPPEAGTEALLESSTCPGGFTDVAAVTSGDSGYLSMRTATGECGRLAIAVHDQRWLIDLWAQPFHQGTV